MSRKQKRKVTIFDNNFTYSFCRYFTKEYVFNIDDAVNCLRAKSMAVMNLPPRLAFLMFNKKRLKK